MPSISVTNPEVITKLDLGITNPKLGGAIDLSAFKVLSIFDGASHDLSSFQNYSHLSTFTSVDLSNNKLTGNAPDFLSSSSCKIVDLSNNELAGALPNVLPSGIQVFRAPNNNFATIDTSGTVYSTIVTDTTTFSQGATFTKTDAETFTIVSSSATSDHSFVNFVNSTNGLQVGKHRMTFDAVVNSGDILKIDAFVADNDADSTNGTSYVGGVNGFKIQPGSNVYDFEIFDDGVGPPSPNISFRINKFFNADISFTNFKIIRDPVGYGNVGIPDFSTLTSLSEYNIENQSNNGFGTSRNTYGHATPSNPSAVLNWSGPSELSNASIDVGSIEGAIPESIRIINLRQTNISKISKRILLTQLYDTFNGKGTDWAKNTAVNGVNYSVPKIDVANQRGNWNAAAGAASALASHQKLVGKHTGVTIKEAKDELADVGFDIIGF